MNPTRMGAAVSMLPVTLTLGNGLCGVVGLGLVAQGGVAAWPQAVCFIGIGWLFDLVDGPVARRLGMAGELGAVLDSLSDAVTFGALPAVLIMLAAHVHGSPILGLIAGAAYMAAVLMRLARFTVRAIAPEPGRGSSAGDFSGLPSSPAAFLMAGLILMAGELPGLRLGLPIAAIGLALLMSSAIPFPKPAALVKNWPWAMTLLSPVPIVGLTAGWAAAAVAGAMAYVAFGPLLCRR